jgi:N-acetyl-anhydromuramyl-L-alanine amidase AmpD
MDKIWTGCADANFRAGRPAGFAPTAIVVHRTGCSLQGFRAMFADPTSARSAHYGIGFDGRIEQYVAEADTAFHAGVVAAPSWSAIRANVNPNFYTIGIEHEGLSTDAWPDAQVAASAALIAEISERWSIAIDGEHVIAHSAIRASANCPGSRWPRDRILDLARPAIESTTDQMQLAAAPPAPAASTALQINRTLALPGDQYYQETTRKDLIVLHFTAGTTAASAVEAWRSTPDHVATAYIVDADGTVYEVFPPSAWAYHLGIKGGTAIERRSIGIEIANVGPLQPSAGDPNALNWWPGDFGRKFCGRDETAKYVEVREGYRGKQYFAAFPGAQIDAVSRLVADLCDRFGIARRLAGADARLACDLQRFASYTGIATHVNFRHDKWDIGPALDWDRLRL